MGMMEWIHGKPGHMNSAANKVNGPEHWILVLQSAVDFKKRANPTTRSPLV